MRPTLKPFLLALLILPSIRVAILKDVSKVTIEGDELWVNVGETKPVSYHIDTPARIISAENGFKIGRELFTYPSLQIGSQKDTLTVDGKNFEGTVELRRGQGNKFLVLNELPLEKYLVGLVHGEISSSWPTEALKAQVVAARTYALFRQKQRQGNLGETYDLESDTSDQVYVGSGGDSADQVVEDAIQATAGQVLWYQGLYPTYFHSCCGGQTETADRVWGKKEVSSSVVDSFCENSPYHNWELRFSQRQFLNALKGHGLEGSRIKSIVLERYETSPRNAIMIIETNETTLFLGANELRKIIGYKELKSTRFDVDWNPREVIFKGMGFGHGVGLCQWGAKAMAEKGADYQTILQYYYPKAVLRKFY